MVRFVALSVLTALVSTLSVLALPGPGVYLIDKVAGQRLSLATPNGACTLRPPTGDPSAQEVCFCLSNVNNANVKYSG
jgi:hypothetical protein